VREREATSADILLCQTFVPKVHFFFKRKKVIGEEDGFSLKKKGLFFEEEGLVL